MTTSAVHTTERLSVAVDHCGGGCPSLRLAGHMPTGMLDWPGLVTTTLFLSGCPLRCPYCHNPGLLVPHSDHATWERVATHLSVRRGWIDGVVVSGGEPTADPDILQLLETLAKRGLRVKLDTNGIAPGVLRTILEEELVDYVALDVKTFPDRYHLLGSPEAGAAMCESIDLLLTAGIDHEFRTTVFPPVIEPSELPRLVGLLEGGLLYALQQYRPGKTLDPSAEAVPPASPLDLLAAAEACSQTLPTITRGV